jgi:hypothetical protein
MKKSILKNALQIQFTLIFSSLTLTLSACGNLAAPAGITVPNQGYYNPSYYPTGASTPDTNDLNVSNYTCPYYSNIAPTSGMIDPSSFNYYKLCPNRMSSSSSKFLLSTTSLNPATNQKVCVFAAYEQTWSANLASPRTTLQPEIDPGTNQPLFQCVDLSQGSAFLSFPSTGKPYQWNAAFIVSERNQAQMSACLLSRSPSTCPIYSVGKF